MRGDWTEFWLQHSMLLFAFCENKYYFMFLDNEQLVTNTRIHIN